MLVDTRPCPSPQIVSQYDVTQVIVPRSRLIPVEQHRRCSAPFSVAPKITSDSHPAPERYLDALPPTSFDPATRRGSHLQKVGTP